MASSTIMYGIENENTHKNTEQVDFLKDQIAKYEQIARYADRQAQRLMSRDFTTYRHYIRIRDRNQAIANELKKKLEKAENLPPHLQKSR